MRAAELAEVLAQDARAIAAYLLPNGKEHSGEWCVGSIDGEAGQSLKVRVSGSKAGTWKDFAAGHGGDLLDLWGTARGLSMSEAMREVRQYLGVREPDFAGAQPKRPTLGKPKCAKPAAKVLSWLRDTRGFSDAAILTYQVAEQGDKAVFPFKSPDGELWGVKYRQTGESKIKTWWEEGSVARLFGWQAIPAAARSVVICEGEPDALAWFDYGFPALSVPAGAKGHSWLDIEFEELQRFDVLYLSFDMDTPGQDGLRELVGRLGRERCHIVELPHKDANDCLKAGVAAQEMARLISTAKTLDPEELKCASYFSDEVVREFYPPDAEPVGFTLPYAYSGARFRFRPGEVTLLAGVNGHGKTQQAGHITLEACSQGERACVASMEFKPKRWLYHLTRQACGTATPAIPFIRGAFEWYAEKLWVFDVIGTAKAARVIEVFQYARRRYGIRFFVIDNLAKCGFAEDDYNGQKDFVDRLTDFAKETESHVLLLLHMRKGRDESQQAGKMDIKGTGALTDMVDNVLIIWRNKGKEESRRIAEKTKTPFDNAEKPDALLICEKQRNGEEEPRFALWFCHKSHQYLTHPGQPLRDYIEWEAPHAAGF